jgi:hypothetical protein
MTHPRRSFRRRTQRNCTPSSVPSPTRHIRGATVPDTGNRGVAATRRRFPLSPERAVGRRELLQCMECSLVLSWWCSCECFLSFQRPCVLHIGKECDGYIHSLVVIHYTQIYFEMSHDSLVGIATGYGLDSWGVGVPFPVVKNFLFSTSSRPALGPTQPPIQRVPGSLSPGVKRPECEVDHSPTSAEAKKMWIYTSTPPYAFMA